MGRRRIHAPKRGSLSYLPRGRAASHIGRINYWPEVGGESPTLLGFAGYKAGMSYVYLISDHRGSPTFGQEVFTPVTVIETPPMLACGIRSYTRTSKGLKSMAEGWMKKLPKDTGRFLSIPEGYDTDAKMKEVEESLEKATDLRIVFCTQPRLAGVSQNKPEIMEVKVDGGTIKDGFEYAKKILGKKISISDVFREGQTVDIAAVTKGKGIQGVVKRWGVKRKRPKARKSVRQVGTLGAWTPHYVMYSVPRAGQMGFHHRTEKNKRILKIGSKGEGATPEGGFPHYGVVRSDFLLLSGSTPGPAKRLIKLRYTAHSQTRVTETPPQINFVGIKAKS